jgi:hypothetical protein
MHDKAFYLIYRLNISEKLPEIIFSLDGNFSRMVKIAESCSFCTLPGCRVLFRGVPS